MNSRFYINLYGYMGAGKTTLSEWLRDECGFYIVDEKLWKVSQ
jgi:dephospho-CoA kinase